MAASKQRVRWGELPGGVQAGVEWLAGAPVTAALNCTGGFSPGLASRLTLADGRRVFVKAMDGRIWPGQAALHRAEARVAAALPAGIAVPRFLGSFEDGRWVALAFECVDGAEPAQPWKIGELRRVVTALGQMALTLAPVTLPGGHPRLGGWAGLSGDSPAAGRLRALAPWAAGRLGLLAGLEQEGLAAARGSSLVHFDAYPHNILLAAGRVVFVDWAHARAGAPFIDLLLLLSSTAADGLDPEPFLRDHELAARAGQQAINAVLAAHAGFCLTGALEPVPVGLAPVAAAKLRLGLGTLAWLARRLGQRG